MKFKDEWKDSAKCVGDDRFISEASATDDVLRGVCSTCPVLVDCARWVLDEEACGVFAAGQRWPDVWVGDPFAWLRGEDG